MRIGGTNSPETRAKISAAALRRSGTLADRFWAKVKKAGSEECWNWTGSLNNEGYGLIWKGHRVERASRVAWILAGNELPPYRRRDGNVLVIDHTCRNRACVNIAHLRLVTQYRNATENSASPHARNKALTECKHGHPFSDENTAITPHRDYRSKRLIAVRQCLTCRPMYWKYAVIERAPPSLRCRGAWVGPFKPEPK